MISGSQRGSEIDRAESFAHTVGTLILMRLFAILLASYDQYLE